MKIVKKIDNKILSRIIDDVILKISYPWRLDKITFLCGIKNKIVLKNNEAEIYFDINEPMEKLKGIVLYQIFSLISKLNEDECGIELIDNIKINREIVKSFGDDYFYYCYISMIFREKGIEKFSGFLRINIPWLSFYSDTYDSQFFREMVDKFKYKKIFQRRAKKLFSALEKNLSDKNNLKEAIKIYKRMRIK